MTDRTETTRAVLQSPADLLEFAKDISREQAKMLQADICPSCGAPLLRGARVGYCTDCGSEVDRC